MSMRRPQALRDPPGRTVAGGKAGSCSAAGVVGGTIDQASVSVSFPVAAS